jgi:hypothetical protein
VVSGEVQRKVMPGISIGLGFEPGHGDETKTAVIGRIVQLLEVVSTYMELRSRDTDVF